MACAKEELDKKNPDYYAGMKFLGMSYSCKFKEACDGVEGGVIVRPERLAFRCRQLLDKFRVKHASKEFRVSLLLKWVKDFPELKGWLEGRKWEK